MDIAGIDWSRFDTEETVRGLNREEREKRLGEIMELQGKINKLKITLKNQRKEKKKKRQEREEENDRSCRESYERNKKEREKKEERGRIDEEWKKIENMRIKEERRAEKEWRRQEMQERRREERRQIAMEERKCFACGGFGHMAYSCKNVGKEGPAQVPSNRFEVLKVRVIQRGKGSDKEMTKDRKKILREERAKRGEGVRQMKIERKEKKEKLLREVIVKIGLKQKEEEEGVVTEALLDSGAIRLVMSEEFARRHKFKRTKLERPVYMRNVDGMLNYAGPIIDTVEVEIFFKEHKEQTSINVIESQKWSIILSMPWLGCHNPEIDWKIGEIKMTRCPDKCGKK